MKKRAAGMFFMIAAIWAAALLIRGHMAAPKVLSGGKSVAIGRDGEIYVAVSDRGKTGICRVTAGGTVNGWYPSDQNAGEIREAGPMICHEGSLICVTPVKTSETGRPARWDIEKIEEKDGRRILLGSFGRDTFSIVTDVRADDNTVKVCGVSLPGDSVLSAEVGGEMQRTFYRLPAGESARDAVYAGDTVAVLTDRGRVGFFGAGEFQTIDRDGAGAAGKLIRGEGRAWIYDSGNGELSGLYPGTKAVIEVRPGTRMTDAWVTDSGEYAILEGTADGGGRLSQMHNGRETSHAKLKSGLPVLLSLARPHMAPVTLIVLACAGFLLLLWKAFGKNGRISLQLSLLSAALILFSGGLWVWTGEAWRGEREELILWAGAVILLAILIYYTVIEWITRPLRELSDFADRISTGEYRVDKRMRSVDEVGRAWSALNRLCTVLSDRRYKYQTLMDAQSRMIPGSLARLLGENSLSLLEPGSGKTIDGTVGILAVSPGDRSGKKIDGEERRVAAKACCRAMAAAESSGGAAAAVDGFRLSGTRILLPGGKDQAAALCRELSQSFTDRDTGEALRFGMMYLAHRTDYLLGVDGNGKRLIPYLLSDDLDWLESYLPDFQSSGVKAAVTDAFLRMEGKPLECRHIGYLASRDGKRRQRVYELLEACGNEEKRLKKKWNGYFQKGLRLYYSNDFYMARGVFSEILKECPFDGIARWYLFAGEERFHAGDQKGSHHALFGRNSDE